MRSLFFVFILLLGLPAYAGIEEEASDMGPKKGSTTVWLEELTWSEIRDAVYAGKRTVIIPTGGTEQNGLHMVTGKHNYIVHEAAEKIARTLGNALVAPVLPYSPEGRILPPEGHMRYAGTISLKPDTFERVLEDAARSFRQHGFTLICFVGDSGPNQEPQARVAERLSKEWAGERVRVLHVSDYYSEKNGQSDWLLKQGENYDDVVGHAALADTSELLRVHPEGVREKAIKVLSTGDHVATGSTGSPYNASKLYGERLLGLKVDAAVRQIRGATMPAQPVQGKIHVPAVLPAPFEAERTVRKAPEVMGK